MKLSRGVTIAIQFILDQLIPPLIRDSVLFLPPVFRSMFGADAETLLSFKRLAPKMSDEDYADAYRRIAKHNVRRESDLNASCIELLRRRINGVKVLDAGCGNGFLSGLLSNTCNVTGADIHIGEEVRRLNSTVTFVEAFVENLPFPDGHFDTVVCTHTLEHVRDVEKTIAELRRVARHRIFIVVPMQRPYKFTFDLHLQFFPYPHSLELALAAGAPRIRTCEIVGGDLLYEETFDER